MRFLFLTLLLSTAAMASNTFDLKHRFGVGTGAGWTIPVLSEDFKDIAEDDLTSNFHARYHTSAADSLQFNFQNYDFADTDISGDVYDLMWIHRINEYDKMTPVFRLGAGVADMNHIAPYRDNLKFAGRAGIGFEYALTDDLFASATVDYQYIGQMPEGGDSNELDKVPGQEIHAVVPQVNLTLFFGHDKEMDEDKKDAAAAAAAAGTTTTTTTTTSPAASANDPALNDTDKDGIVDGRDKCPGTDTGAAVDAVGCVPTTRKRP